MVPLGYQIHKLLVSMKIKLGLQNQSAVGGCQDGYIHLLYAVYWNTFKCIVAKPYRVVNKTKSVFLFCLSGQASVSNCVWKAASSNVDLLFILGILLLSEQFWKQMIIHCPQIYRDLWS